MNAPPQRVFYGDAGVIAFLGGDGPIAGFEVGAGDGDDVGAEQFAEGFFGVGSRLSLEGHADGFGGGGGRGSLSGGGGGVGGDGGGGRSAGQEDG